MTVKNVMRGLRMGCGEPLRRPSGLKMQRSCALLKPRRSTIRLVGSGLRR